jgi:hypothetical protein
VKDESCFFGLKFLKSNLHNKLSCHLPMVVRMFWQKNFTLVQFPYKEAMASWKNENKRYGDV